jgi:DNA-directed RNA polymerase subunit K/omega
MSYFEDDDEVDINEEENDTDDESEKSVNPIENNDEVDGEIEDEEQENDDENDGNNDVPEESLFNEINREDDEDDEDEEEDENENYLQKFDGTLHKNYILDFHPECVIHNKNEIELLSIVTRNDKNIIIDELHRTLPFLTKFERARILGQRAKQINSGSLPFVKIPDKVIDGYIIAELELQQKMMPFIIRRPLTNGGSEYWKVKDLENISF